MENLSRVLQKQKKKTHEEIQFYRSVQDFLLLFTGCRKVLGKMAGDGIIVKNLESLVGKHSKTICQMLCSHCVHSLSVQWRRCRKQCKDFEVMPLYWITQLLKSVQTKRNGMQDYITLLGALMF